MLEDIYCVLVVDDEECNRDMLSRRLQRLGYLVSTAASGEEAIRMLENESYDIVLLDLMMPGMDGYAVLEWLRCRPKLSKIPVIMLTAAGEREAITTCLSLGARDFILKPFNMADLRARIRRFLPERRMRMGKGVDSWEGARVLVVEDDADSRTLLRLRLEQAGFEVLDAGNANEGLDALRNSDVDVVLLDMRLPDRPGMELLEELRNDPELSGKPVIVVSGVDDPEQVRRCQELGVRAYLHKPFNVAELRLQVRDCLQSRAAS